MQKELYATINYDLSTRALYVYSSESLFLSKIPTLTMNMFENLSNRISKIAIDFNVTLDDKEKNIRLINHYSGMKNKVDLDKYEINKDLELPVIMGLKPGLHKHTKTLLIASKGLTKDVITIIEKYISEVSDFISNKDTRESVTIFHDSKASDKITEDIHKAMKTIIDPKDLTNKMSIEKMVPSISLIDEITTDTNEVNKLVTAADIKKIHKLSNVLYTRMDVVHDLLEKEDVKVSKKALESIINNTGSIANMLTAVAMFYNTIYQVENMVIKIMEKIEK